jgi:hypothetical protein
MPRGPRATCLRCIRPTGLLRRVLLGVGIAVALVGAFLMLGARAVQQPPRGDISVHDQSGGFYFPIISRMVISLVATGGAEPHPPTLTTSERATSATVPR